MSRDNKIHKLRDGKLVGKYNSALNTDQDSAPRKNVSFSAYTHSVRFFADEEPNKTNRGQLQREKMAAPAEDHYEEAPPAGLIETITSGFNAFRVSALVALFFYLFLAYNIIYKQDSNSSYTPGHSS